ncbi:hypothetical protein C0989_004808 [Termitomyces sp. Mn162]|nr:hypothetical protein C0989_004808 [Termitomyces sp. Mn162]
MQDAHDVFCNAVYAVKEGVQGFYDALLNHAQNMAVFSDELTICEQFLEGIPSDMLVALICNGGLAPEVNTGKEFVSEAKAYKNSIKTAAHYLEHSKKNMGEANDEQEEESAEANIKDACESKGTQEHGKEYMELEMYNNEYYTCGSNSEGLFALTEVPTSEHREKEPSNKVCMQKVQLAASKDTIDHSVLPAQDKKCLIIWVEVNSHQAWMLWDSESMTSEITPLFAYVAGIWVALLATPITLQLGTIGSCFIVNYGARVIMKAPGKNHNVYVDIANFDCYNIIIATPFMRTHKVFLDFVNDQVVIDGRATLAHKLELEDADCYA